MELAGLPTSTNQSPQPDFLRLQQHLYTLAFADRMRMLQQGHPSHPTHPGGFPPFPPLLPAPRFCPPPDLAMFPMAKLDPRLFRVPFPEEPKPQHSYIGLIAMAILSSSEKKLVLADIYQYILDNFPYFRYRGNGWRNSIRHNLSINDCFTKAGRAANGKGHFWAVHPACHDDFLKGDFSRRKAQRKVRRYMGVHMEVEEEEEEEEEDIAQEDDTSPPRVSPSLVSMSEKGVILPPFPPALGFGGFTAGKFGHASLARPVPEPEASESVSRDSHELKEEPDQIKDDRPDEANTDVMENYRHNFSLLAGHNAFLPTFPSFPLAGLQLGGFPAQPLVTRPPSTVQSDVGVQQKLFNFSIETLLKGKKE